MIKSLLYFLVLGAACTVIDVNKGAASAATSAKAHTNSVGMEFVLIPAGNFLMGASDREATASEKPQHRCS